MEVAVVILSVVVVALSVALVLCAVAYGKRQQVATRERQHLVSDRRRVIDEGNASAEQLTKVARDLRGERDAAELRGVIARHALDQAPAVFVPSVDAVNP